MIFIACLPIIELLLFNFCIGKDPKGLRLGYISEEISRGISDCSSAPITGCHLDSHLSCRYIKTLENNSMILNEYNSIDDGIFAVKSNYVWGLLHFPSNYSKSYNNRLSNQMRTNKVDMDLSEVNIWMDMSDKYIGNMIKQDLYSGFIDFQKSLFEDCGWPIAAAEVPVRFKDAVYGTNQLIFTHFGSPACSSIIMFYMPMIFTVAAILMEKTEGLLDRNMTAGLNLLELIISHVVIQLVINVFHLITVVTINFAIFGFPMVGSWFVYTCLCFVIGISGLCYGLCVSAVCSSDIQATIMGIGTFFPLTMVSGMVWPIEGMHDSLRSVAYLLPLTQSTEAYRAITFRGWSFGHPVVYLGIISCIVWTVIFLLISAAMVKWCNGTGSKN